jgi:hypothetical protein
MTIFLPSSQGASRRAGGTPVVLPAPGGAESTSRVPLESAFFTTGRIEFIGRSAILHLKFFKIAKTLFVVTFVLAVYPDAGINCEHERKKINAII